MRLYILCMASVCLLLMFSLPVVSQVDNSILGKYPTHIIFRIQKMTQVYPFCKQSQDRIGEYFLQQDSLATIEIQQKGISAVLDDYYRTPVDKFKGIVLDLEFNDYKFSIASDKSSSLREIVYNRRMLNLSQEMIDKLLICSNSIENQVWKNDFQKERANFQMADSIMGLDKYLDFYKLRNRAKTDQTVKEWYLKLRENNIIDGQVDSILICNELVRYESIRSANQDYWKGADKEVKYHEAMTRNEFKIPQLLRYLEIYERMPINYMAKEALKNKNQIRLSNTQIDSLYLIPQQLGILKKEKNKLQEKFTDISLEYSLVKKILSTIQVESILVEKYKKETIQVVERQVNILKKNNMLSDTDYQKTYKELYDYLLNLRITRALVGLEKSRENIFRLYDLEKKKPELLDKLEGLWKLEVQKQNKPTQF